jgi:peroxiredoxin Q/BCP
VVLGCSPDTVAKQAKFRKAQGLTYPLLADPEHLIASAFGVWKERSFMGRKFMGVERTTFLIDPKGVVAHVVQRVKPAGHADEVANTLKEIAKA